MADQQITQISMEDAPSLDAIPTPVAQSEQLAPVAGIQLASNEGSQIAATVESLRASPAGTPKADSYNVVVKAPPAGGMLAYLVGPGAQIQMEGIDLNHATLAQEGGNLRVTLPNGAEILLLDYASAAKDSSTVVITEEGKLPAQQLLVALDNAEMAQKAADVEPAAGPTAVGGEGGGLTPPTIMGLGVGEGEGIFSSVIGTFAIPRPTDAIKTNEFPFDPGIAPLQPGAPVNLPPVAHNDSFSATVGKPITMTFDQLKANDSDPESDPLTLVSVQGVKGGTGATVEIVNGNVVFTPGTMPDPADPTHQIPFQGTASYSYTISDGHGGTSTADVIIEYDPDFDNQNTVLAADDTGTVVAGRAIDVNVLANDSDPEGDKLVPGSVRIISGPDKGTATVNADGSIHYQSVGTDPYFTTIVYEVSDDKGARDTATVTIEVIPGSPNSNNVIAVDDTGEVKAGETKVFNVTGNDVDPQGDTFQITSIVSGPTQGRAVIDPVHGTITYESVATTTGYTETITYEITDARGAKDTATLTINVQPDNSVNAVDDTADMKAGQDVRIDVLSNDSDPQGDSFHIVAGSISQPMELDGAGNGTARGSVTLNADGTITYTDTPGARDSGVVQFTYQIVDSNGAVDTAVVRVTIGTAPNGVDANNDTLTVAENSGSTDITTTLLKNDFDPQGDSFKITGITQPSNGQGTVQLDANGHVSFTPATGYHGPVTFTYTITDSKGATDTAQVNINVQQAPNTELNAGDDNFNTPFNTNLVITAAQVLSNDYDPQGTTLNATNIISTTQPAHGSVTYDAATGQFLYNPADDFHGTDTFTYTIKDAQGDLATATVTVRVGDPLSQDNPVLAVDDSVDMRPTDVRTLNVLTNDSAPDGGLQFVKVIGTLPAGVVDQGNGVFTYTAPAGAGNSSVSFQYEVKDADGDTATATATFHVGPNSVIANDDTVVMKADVNSMLIDAKANDSDPEASLGDTFSITRIVSVSAGTATIENGQIRYTNPSRLAGTETIVYEVTDSRGAKDTATITVNIEPDFNNVIANNDDVTMAADVNSMLINAKANDTDPQGDAFSITRIISVSAGTATIENDQIRYTNPSRLAGTETIVYEITDALGAKSQATITVHIAADYNDVVAVNDVATMGDGVNSILVDAKVNDYDPQGDAFSITRIVSVDSGSATIENGQIRYTNATRDAGTAHIVYEITDALGAKSQATVTVNIAADSNNVVAVNDVATMARDVNSILVDAKANDYDPQGDAFSITRIVSVDSGSATIENGQIRYTNPTRDAGTAHIVYEITDALGAKSQATVTVNIAADTNTVIANNDGYNAGQPGNTIQFNVLNNDSDPQGDSFSIVAINGAPAGLNYLGNGVFNFTGQGRDAYDTSFTYTIRDSRGAESTATVYLHVDAAPNNVVAQNDGLTVNSMSSGTVNAIANDYDPQGDSFHIIGIVQGPNIGSAYVSGGNIVYTAGSTYSAYDTTVVYRIQDSRGAISDATVYIHVNAGSAPNYGHEDNNGSGGGGGGGDCPLTIDLNGDGISISMQAGSTAHFDLNGDGKAEWTAWVNGADDAILAIDRNGNDSIDGINEVFGGHGLDGFSELARLEDTNHDGTVDAKDANWSQLKLWLDANHDGITNEGELHSLADFGITAIHLTTTGTSIQYGDAYISHMGTVEMSDGTTRDAGTVFYTNSSNGHLTGTAANDVLIYSTAADSIDGGQGFDTLKVLSASDITINHDATHSVESIDLANKGADKLTLNVNDVLHMSDNGILTVTGDAVDSIVLTGDSTRGADVTQDGHTYASYAAGNGGTVLVEVGLHVTQEQQH